MRPGWPPAKRQRAIDRDRQCGLLFDDREIAGRAAILDPVDQNRQHVDIRWSAAADVIDAGRRIEPHEIGDAGFAHALLHLAKVTDPRVGALRIVGHVFKHDELAAMGLERAEIGVGGIHQRRDLAHPLREILRPIFGDIEIRIAREDMLNAARAVDPGDAIGRQRRQHRRCCAEPPRAPSAGRAIGFRRFTGNAPARIFADAVSEREREFVGRMQRTNGRDLRRAETLVSAGPIGAQQLCGIEARLAADRIFHQAVGDAVLRVAGREHGVVHELDLGRANPPFACGRKASARAGVLQADPVDYGNAGEDAVEIGRIALRHGQALAPTLRTAHVIHLVGFCAVSPLDQHDGGVAHFLVRRMGKVDEGLVIGSKQLRRFARLGCVTGVGAVGRKSFRQR